MLCDTSVVLGVVSFMPADDRTPEGEVHIPEGRAGRTVRGDQGTISRGYDVYKGIGQDTAMEGRRLVTYPTKGSICGCTGWSVGGSGNVYIVNVATVLIGACRIR